MILTSQRRRPRRCQWCRRPLWPCPPPYWNRAAPPPVSVSAGDRPAPYHRAPGRSIGEIEAIRCPDQSFMIPRHTRAEQKTGEDTMIDTTRSLTQEPLLLADLSSPETRDLLPRI